MSGHSMILLFYLPILTLFAVLFALGYLPVAMLARLLTKRRLAEETDAWAALAGVIGVVAGFLFAGLSGFDRFALAPESVRMDWQNSGSAFVYEMWQIPFSGAVSALVIFAITRRWPGAARNQRLTKALAALVISFVDFSLWPILFPPLL